MYKSVFGLFRLVCLSIPVASFGGLVLLGHDCSLNKTPIDCSNNQQTVYNSCTGCTVPGYNCSQNTGKTWSGATDVYSYTTVEIGLGSDKLASPTSTSTIARCFTKNQCTNTPVLNQECYATGCGGVQPGLFCDSCGIGAQLPGGEYHVLVTENCDGA